MKAIITKGTGKKSDQFTFHLIGRNGKVIAKASEHYTRKSNLKKTLLHYFSEFKIIDEAK